MTLIPEPLTKTLYKKPMQINLKQYSERKETGFGPIIIHKFDDINIERINSFSNYYNMDFITESKVRLYFTLFKDYNVTIIYDFNNDIFSCDFCDNEGKIVQDINHIKYIEKIINKIEEYYIKSYENTSIPQS